MYAGEFICVTHLSVLFMGPSIVSSALLRVIAHQKQILYRLQVLRHFQGACVMSHLSWNRWMRNAI
jgi:hypothetical protein